jgi:CrcB protein
VERDRAQQGQPGQRQSRRALSRTRSAPALDRQELAAIFAGGFVGAVGRAALEQSLKTHPGQWPWATFIVNMLGAALLGYFVTRLQERLPPSSAGR